MMMFSREWVRVGRVYWRTAWRATMVVAAVCVALSLAWAGARGVWLILASQPQGPSGSAMVTLVPLVVAQVILAVQLGLAFSRRSPEAWLMRLPLDENARELFPPLLLTATSVLFYCILAPVWDHQYYSTGHPFFATLLMPALVAYGFARAVKNTAYGALSGAVAAVLAGALVPELFLNPLARWGGEWMIRISHYRLEHEAAYLSLCLIIVAVVATRGRRASIGAAVLIAAIAAALGGLTHHRARAHPHMLEMAAFAQASSNNTAACARYTALSEALPQSVGDEDPETPYARVQDLLQAVELLEAIPEISQGVAEKKMSMPKDLPAAYAIQALMTLGECKTLIRTFNVEKRVASSLGRMQGLAAGERVELKRRAWSATVRTLDQIDTVTGAIIGIATLRLWEAHGLIPASFRQELEMLAKDVEELRAQVRNMPWPRFRVSPPDVLQRSWEGLRTEISRSREFRARLLDLARRIEF